MAKNGFGLTRRLYCAIFNNYPFKSDENLYSDYRDGSIDSFYLEKLNDFKNHKLKNVSFLGIFASTASIISLGWGIYAYHYPNPNANSLQLLLVLIIIGLFLLFSLTILMIWNDKKNYCEYYERLIENSINIQDDTIFELQSELKLKNTIIASDFHYIAELVREIDVKLNDKCNAEHTKIIFQNFLDKLCDITNKLHYSNDVDEALFKYSCCIKLIKEEDIYKDTDVRDIHFKTFIRSTFPKIDIYDNRIKEISSKYDDRYEKVDDNDDFRTIITEKAWYYYLHNFPDDYGHMKYKTSHPESSKYYKSAISFPIIYRHNETDSFILGFLCFDNFISDAFPQCSDKQDKHIIDYDSVWQEFCCSQLDLLSILFAKQLGYTTDRHINKNLVLKKLRRLEFNTFALK
jgi:hypothetical protein